MRFFRRLVGLLGFGKDDGHDPKDEDDGANRSNSSSDDVRRNRMNVDPIPGPRKGFSVPVQVAVERPVGPILVPCNGDGGVQGLRWYAKRLRIDEDGDVADEFLHEVLPEASAVMQDEQKPFPRFQVKSNTRHAKVKRQVLTPDGKFQQSVECQGRLLWV